MMVSIPLSGRTPFSSFDFNQDPPLVVEFEFNS
jgi:hypothetical protein